MKSDCAESARSTMRRNQILCAAATCFRQKGFHGSCIAEIAKTASMSVGHIYHYFENKEAIIAAIVERRLDKLLMIAEQIESDGNREGSSVYRATLASVEWNIDEKMSLDDDTVLMLEIMAEAARNPKVAAMVQKADQISREKFRKLTVLANQGGPKSPEEVDGIVEAISSLYSGIAIRAVCNPGLNRQMLANSVRVAIGRILES